MSISMSMFYINLRITTSKRYSKFQKKSTINKNIACRISKQKMLWPSGHQLSQPPLNASVQFSSVAQLCPTLRPHGLQHARLPYTSPTPEAYSKSCPLHWWCHPTISSSVVPSPPAFNLSQHQGLFQWISSSYQVAKVLELQFQLSPFNECSGLVSFRTDWFDLLAVHGSLKSLLQHHSSKTSVLWCSAFLMVNSHIHTWLLEKP